MDELNGGTEENRALKSDFVVGWYQRTPKILKDEHKVGLAIIMETPAKRVLPGFVGFLRESRGSGSQLQQNQETKIEIKFDYDESREVLYVSIPPGYKDRIFTRYEASLWVGRCIPIGSGNTARPSTTNPEEV